MRVESQDGRTVRIVDGNERVVLRSDESGNVIVSGSLSVAGGFAEGGHLEDPVFVTPVNAVAATATLVYADGTNPAAGKTVTVNGKVYSVVTGPVALEGDVLRGADADATLTNLSRAINKSGGTPGTDYFVALAHPTVSSSINAGSDTVSLTARTKGAAGNALTLTTNEGTITVTDFATVAAGVDGTVGYKGDLRFDASNVYFCTDNNTVADGYWKKAALSAL